MLTAEVLLPDTKHPKLEDHSRFLNETLANIEALPGVKSAGVVGFPPLSGFWGATNFTIEGQAALPRGESPEADFNLVTPSYFRTMQVPLLAGRDFDASDMATGPQVVIVNQTMARQFWPKENPVGKRMSPDPAMFRKATWEIVGVVCDIKHFGVAEATHPTNYRPFAQENFPLMTFVIRTQVPPMALAKAVQQAIWDVDKDQPIWNVITMDEVAESVTLRRISMILLAVFAVPLTSLFPRGLSGPRSTGESRVTAKCLEFAACD